MSAKGFLAAIDGHIVILYNPVDIDTLAGAKSPVVCLMENYNHASIIISIGANPLAAGVITLNACDDIVPTTETAIAFNYYKCETSTILANGDVLGARTAATAAAGIIPTATGVPNFFVIELDAEELTEGSVGFRLCIADPAAASVGVAIAILSGSRYAKDQNLTSMAVI